MIGQCFRGIVTHPTMNPTSSGIEPLDVLELKIVVQGSIDRFDRHVHVLPTNGTNVGTVTTTIPDVVIIGQINIQYKFTFDGLEGWESIGGKGMFLDGGMWKDGPNINFDRQTFLNGRLEII